jgi:hypothetical protein
MALTQQDFWADLIGKRVVSAEVRELDLTGRGMEIIPITVLTLEDGSEFCFSAAVYDRESYYAYLTREQSFESSVDSRADDGAKPRWLTDDDIWSTTS